jgi:hypothetical protein
MDGKLKCPECSRTVLANSDDTMSSVTSANTVSRSSISTRVPSHRSRFPRGSETRRNHGLKVDD